MRDHLSGVNMIFDSEEPSQNSKHPLSPFKLTVENVEPLQNLRLVEIILATSTNICMLLSIYLKTKIPKFRMVINSLGIYLEWQKLCRLPFADSG